MNISHGACACCSEPIILGMNGDLYIACRNCYNDVKLGIAMRHRMLQFHEIPTETTYLVFDHLYFLVGDEPQLYGLWVIPHAN